MSNNQTLKFRCPGELEGRLPPPVPATQGVPDWLKAMPAKAFSAINLRDEETVKRCPPFVDAMTCGFLLPLICDLRIENGEVTWDNEIPPGNRFDLPFTTLSGLVDCDRYTDTWIHFPAYWHNTNFRGVLPKGTPIAQCIPVKRESWIAQTSSFTAEETKRVHEFQNAIRRQSDLYRKKFRA